jgi:RNase adaptor protein for sRNA GlmZ degradation
VAKILITGMSGTGKSAVIDELASLGYRAIDTDDPAWSEWRRDESGRDDWVWREDRIQELLDTAGDDHLFLSGCKSNQGHFYPLLDYVVLLSAPVHTILDRIECRTSNDYGKDPFERYLILKDTRTVEPLLRRSSDLEIDTSTTEVSDVAALLIAMTEHGDQS